MTIEEMINKGYRLYVAYGRYMSLVEMSKLCSAAVYITSGILDNYRLSFHGNSTNCMENVVPCHSNRIYVAVWGITLEDEMHLDTAYNYRFTYTKCRCDVTYNSCTYPAYTYILNYQLAVTEPTIEMCKVLREGYSNNNIDISEWDPRII